MKEQLCKKDFTVINTGTTSYFDFDWFDNEDENEANDFPAEYFTKKSCLSKSGTT